MKNLVLFVGVVLGVALLVSGGVALRRGEPHGWYYLGAGVAALILAAGPGRRLRGQFFGEKPRP